MTEIATLSHQNIISTKDLDANNIETILDNIGAGVISIDKKGKITTFNKAAESILCIQNKNIFGSNYRDAFEFSYHEPIRNLIQKMILLESLNIENNDRIINSN